MRLYAKYFLMQVKSTMQYKTSFWLTMLGQFLVSFNVFLGVYFMFQRFSTVKGFTYSQVLLCFSITLMEFSIAECVARGFDSFSAIISNGEFDRIMVRPRNEILQVLGSRIELTRIGRMVQAIVMFLYGIVKSEIIWTPSKVLTVVFMLIGGTAVFSGIFIVYASICFFTTEGLEFMNILTDGAREYGKYPISIYGKRIFKICTFLVPYTLIQYYPLLFLIGKVENRGYMILPLFACFFLIPCIVLWKFGVRHYKSTGS